MIYFYFISLYFTFTYQQAPVRMDHPRTFFEKRQTHKFQYMKMLPRFIWLLALVHLELIHLDGVGMTAKQFVISFSNIFKQTNFRMPTLKNSSNGKLIKIVPFCFYFFFRFSIRFAQFEMRYHWRMALNISQDSRKWSFFCFLFIKFCLSVCSFHCDAKKNSHSSMAQHKTVMQTKIMLVKWRFK